MKKRRLAALFLALVLCASAAGAEEAFHRDGAAEGETAQEETADPAAGETTDPLKDRQTEDGAAFEAPNSVPVSEENLEEEDGLSLPDLLAVLPEEACMFLNAAALEGAPEYGRCWAELLALIETETAEQTEREALPESDGQEESDKGDDEEAQEEASPLTALSSDTKRYIALRLLSFAQENGLLDNVDAAKGCIEGLVDAAAAEHNPYSTEELTRLNAVSERFSTYGKLAAGVSADRLILRGGEARLQYAPIAYNGRMLLAVEDIAELLGGTAVFQEQGDGLAVQADATLIELEKGSAFAFLNDGQIALSAPVLVFEGHTYASAELLALPGERAGIAFAGIPCFICNF